MKVIWWASVLGVFLSNGPARADLPPPPGFKFRELRVVIDNLGDYPDHAFYLVPSGWLVPAEPASGPGRPDTPPRVVPGKPHLPGYPARFSHTWMLVAVPRQRTEQPGLTGWAMLAADVPGVLYSNRVRLAEPESTILFNPNDYEVHHFRVTLAGGELTLTPGAIERGSDGFRSWLPGLLAAAAVTALGFWIVRRVTRRRPSRAVPAGDP